MRMIYILDGERHDSKPRIQAHELCKNILNMSTCCHNTPVTIYTQHSMNMSRIGTTRFLTHVQSWDEN